MSEENLDIVRRLLYAWNRQDMEGLLALASSEIEYVNSPRAVEPGTKRGLEAVSAVVRAQWDAMEDVRQEIDRTYERGDEVIGLGRMSRRMPGSDARIEDRVLMSWTIRDGKLTRVEVLGATSAEVDRALKAAGLEE